MLYSYRMNVKINKKTFQWPPLYVSTRGVLPQKGPEARHMPPERDLVSGILTEGTWDQACTPSGRDLGPGIPPQKGPGARHTPLSSWTDTCENITFPKLLLRAVINSYYNLSNEILLHPICIG